MSVINFDNTKYSMSAHDLVKTISDRVPKHEQIRILQDIFPSGRIANNTFYIGSIFGEPGSSMKINIDPLSRNFMKGQDFNGMWGS